MADAMQTQTPIPTASPAPTPTPAGPVDPNAKSVLLLVTYLIPIVFVYTMIKKGDKPFFVWHSKNAAAYLLVAIGLNIVFQVLWGVVPDLAGILGMIRNLLNLALFIMVVYFGIVKGSWEGKQTSIPVLTNIGQRLPLEKWFKKDPEAPAEPDATPAPEVPTAPEVPAAPAAPEVPAAPAAPEVPTAPAASSNEQTPPTATPAV